MVVLFLLSFKKKNDDSEESEEYKSEAAHIKITFLL